MAEGVQSRRRVEPALIVAATLSWIPPLLLVLVRTIWTGAPTRIPVHWAGDSPDQWGSATAFFWTMLVPGLGGSLICSLLVFPLSTDVSRRAAAAVMGGLSAGTGAIASVWIAALLTAAHVSAPFLVVLVAVAWGALVAAVSLVRRE
ncbi:hypothetical protein [Tersicoccus sp. Bi-70]|uniref:hypothetical protein n=1 Tax=Tersicoccus sp. Bi-70 TaxID=1897634 RepID=UPI00117CC64B|nr:hypothetical protein [Tersicoccus sp. Bi-70]